MDPFKADEGLAWHFVKVKHETQLVGVNLSELMIRFNLDSCYEYQVVFTEDLMSGLVLVGSKGSFIDLKKDKWW